MHIHILGICGTFMAGIARIACELGYQVTGSDQNIYPPMSTQLNELGIKILEGYDDISQLQPRPDWVVVGNVMSRGMPVIEYLLNQRIPYLSGPEWLGRFVLNQQHVLAVSGTHGKTTTSSMLAWILEYAGLNPGFLIGGIPNDFSCSARLGAGKYFVVEADEYDSAFFDKRSKFVHYRPNTLIINNIEFDHADIFPNLASIQQQFHHLVRTVSGEGLIIFPEADQNVIEVLHKGCWSSKISFGKNGNAEGWGVKNYQPELNQFDIIYQQKMCGTLKWELLGEHNVQNALAAIAAAHHVGVQAALSIEALSQFKGVKRRMEVKGTVKGITVYDDFAHHPSAIATTLEGLRAKVGSARLVAVCDLRSNTMKMGHHHELLANAFKMADQIYLFKSPDILWDVEKVWQDSRKSGGVYTDLEALTSKLLEESCFNDQIIFMSNGGFGGIQNKYLDAIQLRLENEI